MWAVLSGMFDKKDGTNKEKSGFAKTLDVVVAIIVIGMLLVGAGFLIVGLSGVQLGGKTEDKSMSVSKNEPCSSQREMDGKQYEYDEESCFPRYDEKGNHIFKQDRDACLDGSWMMSNKITQEEAEKLYEINPENGCIKMDKDGEYIQKMHIKSAHKSK
jgi:hypothetical protein